MASTSGPDRYVLDRRIGGGGMAEVFLAHAAGAEGFRRPVAIKRVLPGYSDDAAFAAMFIAEARLSARLDHPNIVMVSDFDRDAEQRLFLVMEYVDGASLDAVMAGGELPVAAAIHIATELLRGLGHAHAAAVVHRDVSPHNVLLGWTGDVKVSDFGIAKARAATTATASDVIKGKPAYMSPEQANGEELDGRSDLFAVGIVVWEMLCGRPLFAGKTTQETLARLLFAPIPSPREARPEVGADLERVVLRLLARDRDVRYPSAEDALADLVACADAPSAGRDLVVELLETRLRGGTREERVPAPAPAPLPGPVAATVRSRRRGLVIAAALGAALAAGVATTVAVVRSDDDAPAPLGRDALVAQGRAALARKSYPEAATLFRQAFDVGHDPETLRMAGDAERAAMDCPSAMAAYDRYLQLVGSGAASRARADIAIFRRGCQELISVPELPASADKVKLLVQNTRDVLVRAGRTYGAALVLSRGYDMTGDVELLWDLADTLYAAGACKAALVAYDEYVRKVDPSTVPIEDVRAMVAARHQECEADDEPAGGDAGSAEPRPDPPPDSPEVTAETEPTPPRLSALGRWPDPSLLPRVDKVPDDPSYDVVEKVVVAAADRAEIACDAYPGPGVHFDVSIAIDAFGHAEPSVTPAATDAGGDAATATSEFARCYWWILATAAYPVSKSGALWTNIGIVTTAKRDR